jgi:hypothetical protein
MKWSHLILVVLFFSLSGCSSDSGTGTEPANLSEFHVVNNTESSLDIRLTSPVLDGEVSAEVEPGEFIQYRGQHGGYEDFSLPSQEISCVSVYDPSNDTLLFQQFPIADGEWESLQSSYRVTVFTLSISPELLSASGVANQCGP